MVGVDYAQLQQWLLAFFWPFCRITAFLLATPLFGHSGVPARVKIALAVLLSVLLGPNLPPLPEVALFSWPGLGITVEQMLIGLAIGMVMRVTFAAAQTAGDIIGLQMGLGFATFFSPDTGTNSMVLSRLLYTIALLLFLAFDGHLLELELLAGTFASLPIGLPRLDPSAWEMLARYGGTLFVSGLLLALPLVASLLIVNLAMGILNRSAPQLTVFSVGFPLSLSLGLLLLTVLMGNLGGFIQGLLRAGLDFIMQLTASLSLTPV
ncbi:flagellar biosynthetic protein FliR [Azotobacter vinelandii]|uniref:flagellar biosynthetic protein FliR n=1 Tax=Azotobacter vinelandii TaxID=354 RepID=UPI00266508D5|nr:flagellar biosynthetic protein FliR [Azotobacter vinelandii]WKN24280.1 flagellar biosynthetic protein FliR [Azotobacter vinelandii]